MMDELIHVVNILLLDGCETSLLGSDLNDNIAIIIYHIRAAVLCSSFNFVLQLRLWLIQRMKNIKIFVAIMALGEQCSSIFTGLHSLRQMRLNRTLRFIFILLALKVACDL